jgi:uracil-DNA glycosylase
MIVGIEDSWKEVLQSEFEKPYFPLLTTHVANAYSRNHPRVFPDQKNIFKAFNACPFHKVKVVILGQDPYPTYGHAHGLSFSIEENVIPFPRSLQNIFKEISSDLTQPMPNNGNLLRWSEQGVLLLNSLLTVEEGQPNSHANFGWEFFTDAVIIKLAERKTPMVFMLWGSKAKSKVSLVDSGHHLILTAPHPSPLSAHKGFLGCKHFSLANEFLLSKGSIPIQW